MKILRIVSSGFEEGGVENGIVLMQPIFNKLGHEIKIMASDRRMDLPRFDDYTFKSINPKKVTKYIFNIFNPYSFFKLKKVLKEYKPDLVQLHTMGQVSPSVLFLLKKVPTVLTIHGPEAFTKSLLMWYFPINDFKDHSYHQDKLTVPGKFRYFYYRYLVIPVYKIGIGLSVNKVVTLSRYMQKLIESDGIKNEYIPNGAVLIDQKPLNHNKVFAYVGRLEKFKGVDYLLKAMAMVIKQYPEAKLIVAGEGSYRRQLEKITSELNIIDNILFKGHVSRSDIKNIYENSTALVMPSVWPEAFGKVGIEAMSVGRPVIASDVGGVTDWLIDNKNGYLIPPKDHEAIARAMLKLLENPTKLAEMSLEARSTSLNFSLEHHVDLMIKLYQDIIKK